MRGFFPWRIPSGFRKDAEYPAGRRHFGASYRIRENDPLSWRAEVIVESSHNIPAPGISWEEPSGLVVVLCRLRYRLGPCGPL